MRIILKQAAIDEFSPRFLRGWTGQVDRKAGDGIDEEAINVSGRHLFANVEVSRWAACDEGLEGFFVYLIEQKPIALQAVLRDY